MHHKKIFHGIDMKVIFFLAFLMLGIVIAMQNRSVLSFNKEKTTTSMRIESYKEQLETEKKNVEQLKKAIADNEKKKEEYLKGISKNHEDNEYLNKLSSELDRVKMVAGLTEVKGNGVKITLDDAPAAVTEHPEWLIIHDSDVVNICNELKKAGAQAISINGERIIANSELVCAGPTIKINRNRYPVPFEIMAIGDQEVLAESLENSRIMSEIRGVNIKTKIEKADEIIIEKYNYKIDDLITSMEVAK
jgi:uncharacterized protein YlxW (UPF0749 family)